MALKISHACAAAWLLLLMQAMPLPAHATDTAATATATTPTTTWVYPVIKGYGKVHPRADAAVQPDPNAEYKVIVDVVTGNKDRGAVLGSLQRLARIVNLMGFAKVPPSQVHIVAVL
ncbi:MAG: hypothetical protein ABI268_05285, partial [Rhodanobacter sp.]